MIIAALTIWGFFLLGLSEVYRRKYLDWRYGQNMYRFYRPNYGIWFLPLTIFMAVLGTLLGFIAIVRILMGIF
jgi:hypothetical protein